MKTIDMAKENNFVLREAAKAACDGYFTHLAAGGKGDPAEERWIEALTAGADAITQVVVLESRLAQVERERDAAVADILHVLHTKGTIDAECLICDMEKPDCHWECEKSKWRGVCPENAKEDADENIEKV